MLLKSKISEYQISLDPVLNEKYLTAKLGKFTSSEWHSLMGEKGIGSAGLNYIYRKVGEELTGLPVRQDISTPATEHGLTYEREGLVKFGEKMGVQGTLLVQRLILDGDRCGGTPDAIWVKKESIDGLSYEAATVEVKCPLSFDGYIRAWKCKTPAEFKKEKPDWYWQVLHQMYICDCLVGYGVIYHPFFKSGQLNIIEFRKISTDIYQDIGLIAQRKNQSIQIFHETINQMKNE